MGFDFRRQFAALQAGAQLTADLRNFNNVNMDCRKQSFQFVDQYGTTPASVTGVGSCRKGCYIHDADPRFVIIVIEKTSVLFFPCRRIASTNQTVLNSASKKPSTPNSGNPKHRLRPFRPSLTIAEVNDKRAGHDTHRQAVRCCVMRMPN